MSKQFEEVLKTLPAYKNQVFIHGERLLIKDGDVYWVASVQLAYELWKWKKANG